MITPEILAAIDGSRLGSFDTTAAKLSEPLAKHPLPCRLRKPRHVWQALGFVFYDPEIDDKNKDNQKWLFQEVSYPPGWGNAPTKSHLWTDIIDEHGRVRGAIFYKAEAHDLRAHAVLYPRFSVGLDLSDRAMAQSTATMLIEDRLGLVNMRIDGLTKVNWAGDRAVAEAASSAELAAERKLKEWLDTNYPAWTTILGHWQPKFRMVAETSEGEREFLDRDEAKAFVESLPRGLGNTEYNMTRVMREHNEELLLLANLAHQESYPQQEEATFPLVTAVTRAAQILTWAREQALPCLDAHDISLRLDINYTQAMEVYNKLATRFPVSGHQILFAKSRGHYVHGDTYYGEPTPPA